MASVQSGGVVKTDIHVIIRIFSQSSVNIHNSQMRVIFNKFFKINIPISRHS